MQENYPRVKLIVEPSKGVARALNSGIRAAETKYIARLDSDDEMLPERIQMQLNYLESNSDCVLVGSQLTYITEEGEVAGLSKYPESSEQILKFLTFSNPIAHPSVMYRRDEILKAGLYNPRMEGAEDLDMWIRLSIFGKFKNLSTPLTRYRQHVGQISSKKKTIRSEIAIRFRIMLRSRNSLQVNSKGYLLNVLRFLELLTRLLFGNRKIRIIPKSIKSVVIKYVS
jgi:glycosyltransferase involved in cell wall biosynthesis